MKALIISPLLFERDYPEWERRTETSFGFKTLISWKYTQHTNVLNVTSGDSSNMKKKSSLCLYTYEWSNISLYCLVQQQQQKKSDWKVTEIAEARHMKENADKHVTLLVFYLVLGIFSWPNDAKKNLILNIVNFSRYSSDICLKIQMLKPSSASLMLLPVSQCFK